MKLTEKCWSVNLDKIDEGYCYSEQSVYAETRNKAKSLLMQKYEVLDMILNGTNEEVTYLTLPVYRDKDGDKYDFNGKSLTMNQIQEVIQKNERIDSLNTIMNNNNITHCYIRKRGSYYCPNCSGYTQFQSMAGVYEKEDAIRQAKSCDQLDAIPIDNATHNKMISERIEDLKTRIINN